MKKNVLAIETSSPVLSVALQKGDETVLESEAGNFMTHAENLLPAIAGLLKKKGLTLNEVGALLIGRGPGSFTGLRIGFATLKGFLAAEMRSCFGALSLDIIADGVNLPDGSRLGVCLDARRDKIYARFYRKKETQWQPENPPQALSLDDFAGAIHEETHLTGEALRKYQKQITDHKNRPRIHFLPESLWYPRASHLIGMYRKLNFKDGLTPPLQRLKKPSDFVPFYLRLSEPEEKRKAYAHSQR